MSLQPENRTLERGKFARSDADALTTAFSSDFYERFRRRDLHEYLHESAALAELLQKGQMRQRLSLGAELSARLEDAGELHAFIYGFMGSGVVLDDSCSTAVLGSEWPYPKRPKERFCTWGLFSTEPPASIGGARLMFAATPAGDTSADAQTHPKIQTDPKAAERLRGHESIIREIGRIAAELSGHRGLRLVGIRVRPAWSNEYEERTGVVVQVTLRASSEELFAYWEDLGQSVDALTRSLPTEQSRFLDSDLSVIVKRT